MDYASYVIPFVTFFLSFVATIYIVSAVMVLYYTYSIHQAIGKFVGFRTLCMDLVTGPVGAIRICFGYLQLQLAIAEYNQSLVRRPSVTESATSGRIRMTTRPPDDRLN